MLKHGYQHIADDYYLVILDQLNNYLYAEIRRINGQKPKILCEDGNWVEKLPEEKKAMKFFKKRFSYGTVIPDYWLDENDNPGSKPVYFVRYKTGVATGAWQQLPSIGKRLPAPGNISFKKT